MLTITFSSKVHSFISKDKDLYLSKASLEALKSYLPEVDLDANFDLLPVAFNACVVNRFNKNDDGISTNVALAIYKNFINKPINVEHKRNAVIGVISTAGFSEFGTDKPLTEKEVRDTKKPFNLTLGGFIWRSVNEDISEAIEDSSNPESENYLSISASWELGFTDFELVVIDGDSKNMEDGEVVEDQEDALKNLRSYGGKGEYKNKKIYRNVIGQVLPMGVGFTETPAAEVKGICTNETQNEEAKEVKSSEQLEKNKENISQSNQKNVNERNKDMKISKIEDINDENLKEAKASEITKFIAEEIKKVSEDYVKEQQKREKELEETKAAQVALQKQLEETKADSTKIQEELSKLKAAQEAREKEDSFNQRMASLDETYVLGAEDRKVIAAQIKDMNDEQFAKHQESLAVLLKEKSKEYIAAKQKELDDAKALEISKASEEKGEAKDAEVIDESLKAAKAQEAVPASSSEQTPMERYAKAFSMENVEFKK